MTARPLSKAPRARAKSDEPLEGLDALHPLEDVRVEHATFSVLDSPSAVLLGSATSADNSLVVPDFRAIYAAHFQRVSHWVRAFGGLDADVDDLTQEVFLVVQRKLSSFRGPNMAAWLYGIARKTVSDHRRRAWVRRWLRGADPDDSHAPSSADPGANFERTEARHIVASILNEMSAVRRSTFILFEIEGYSGEEIAALEAVPVNTVYTRLHHARKDFFRLMTARTRAEGER